MVPLNHPLLENVEAAGGLHTSSRFDPAASFWAQVGSNH